LLLHRRDRALGVCCCCIFLFAGAAAAEPFGGMQLKVMPQGAAAFYDGQREKKLQHEPHLRLDLAQNRSGWNKMESKQSWALLSPPILAFEVFFYF
jgi:hypothetical protein